MEPSHSHRVSVIIPAYNSANYIQAAIRSVLSQTYTDYEIIVADDGSTDDTRARVRTFGDRVRLLELDHHGISATRNAAIRASHGDLIALLDSDDLWDPDKLDLQVAYLDTHPDYALVYSYSTNFTGSDEGRHNLVKKVDFEGWVFKDLFTKDSFGNSTIVLRRSVFDALGGYDESLTAMEDYDLVLRVARAYPIGRVPKSLVRRRIHPHSFYTSGYDNQYIYQLPVYDRFMSDPAVAKDIGQTKTQFMTAFITKFIYKNLFDDQPEFIAAKLSDLAKYDRHAVPRIQQLVDLDDTSAASWRPLIPQFDTWHGILLHKQTLFKDRNAARS